MHNEQASREGDKADWTHLVSDSNEKLFQKWARLRLLFGKDLLRAFDVLGKLFTRTEDFHSCLFFACVDEVDKIDICAFEYL